MYKLLEETNDLLKKYTVNFFFWLKQSNKAEGLDQNFHFPLTSPTVLMEQPRMQNL